RSADADSGADGPEALQALVPLVPSSGPRPLDSARPAAARHWVLCYVQARGQLWLLVLSRGNVRLRELSTSADAVAALIDRLLAVPDDLAAAGRLGEALLPTEALPTAGVAGYLLLAA